MTQHRPNGFLSTLIDRLGAAHRTVLVAACCGVVLSLAACDNTPSTVAVEPVAAPPGQAELAARMIEFKNKLQKDPYAADARFGLGQVLIEQADLRGGERELTGALSLGMDPNIVLPVLARTWLLVGKSKELIETHANTQLTNPSAAAELKAALANAYANTGDAAKARAMTEVALKSDPGSARARVVQAKIALSDRRIDDAMRGIEETLAAHPRSTDAWELKGDILLLVRANRAGATAAYEQVLAIEPWNVPVHAKLIGMAFDERDLKVAQGRLDRLTLVAPTSLPVRYFKARVAFVKGDLNTAQEEIKAALSDYPNDIRSLLLSAEMDMLTGSLRTAEESLGNALAMNARIVRTRHLAAQLYLRLGSPEKALAILDPLVRSGGTDGTALGLSAEAAMQLKLPSTAMKLYERAAAADPANPRFRATLAMARIAKGDVEAGINELETAAAADRGTYSDMALLSARLRTGDLPAAIQVAERVARKQPKQAMPQWTLGQLMRRSGKPDEARQYFERAIALDKAFVPAAVSMAEMDLEAKDPAGARRRLTGVLALNPKNLDALLALAEIQQRTGDKVESVTAALEEAVRLNPGESRSRLALINHLIRAGQGPAALAAAQLAAGELPYDQNLIDALGRAQLAAGDSAQALATIRRVMSARPNSPEPHLRLAEIYESRGELGSAIDELKEAIRLGPKLLSAQIKLTELATASKNWPMALRAARNVQQTLPTDPRGFHLEGLVFAAQKKWDPALVAFRAATQRRESSELALQLHTALRGAGKTEDARLLAADWLSKRPKDNYFIGYLGELALLSKDFAAAEGHFQSILKTDPRNVDALNNLAWVLLQQSKPEALETARKASELQPGRADVLDTLSMALAGAGQLSAALQNQTKAVELAPGTPGLRLNLARLAVQSKDFVLARAQLNVLSALGNAFPDQAAVWKLRQELP